MISLRKKPVTLDIVIPIYNEEKIVERLFAKLSTVFSKKNLQKKNIKSVKYIVVDDGSNDSSANLILKKIEEKIPIKLLRLSRNFGHQNAVFAGLEHSKSDVTAVIDADLQDPPELILEMVDKWRLGYDVIYAERKKRKEIFFKTFSYWLFYRILSFLSDVDIPKDSGDFSLMDKIVVSNIIKLPERLKYPRVMRAWVGFKKIGIPYERNSRVAGESKYSFVKLIGLALDCIASASIKPLRISQYFIILYFFITVFFILLFSFKYFKYYKNSIVQNKELFTDELTIWFLFAFTIIFFVGFVQTFSLYIISAYLGRTYLESKGRPPYILLEVVDGKKKSSEKR